MIDPEPNSSRAHHPWHRRLPLEVIRAYTRFAPWEKGKMRLERFARRHLIPPRPVVARIQNGLRMELDPRDLLQSILYFRGMYEPEAVAWVKAALRRGDTLIDVGANIGLYSLIAAQRIGPNGRVIAFEPVPSIRQALEANVERNRLSNVRIEAFALSNEPGSRTIYVGSPGNVGKSSFSRENAGSDEEQVESVGIETVRLDDYLADHRIGKVRLLKVDVEGAEQQVFEGASQLLRDEQRPILLFEASELLTTAFGTNTVELKRWLVDLGYSIHRIVGQRLVSVPTEEPHRLEDLVALSPVHRKETHLARWLV